MGPDGDLYVGDRDNHVVRRVTTAGVVTTYAGSGTQGFADGAPLSAKFIAPAGIAVAANGDVLVADFSDNRVRRIVRAGAVAGSVETLAGNGSPAAASPDGIGTAAGIPSPIGIVVRGNTLTLRDGQGLVRQIDLTTKAVTTLAGSRLLGEGFADGTTVTARMRTPGWGITGAPAGAFVTADDLALRLVSASGDVSTFASHAAAGQTPTGVGTLAQQPFGLAINRFNALTVDSSGRVVVADDTTAAVRRIDATGAVTLVAGLTGGFSGVTDGIGSEAQFVDLGTAIASGPAGVLYAADDYGVRRIGANSAVTMLAGSTATFGAVNGNATTARFNRIFGLAVGPSGDVFAGDAGNNAVRRIDAAGNVTTYAGVMGQSGQVDGPIATARFASPRMVAFGPDGSLYVSDGVPALGQGLVRKISADGSTVSTIAAAGGQVTSLTVDAADILYYFDAGGLWKLPAGAAAPTLLIPITAGNNVLGTSPRLFPPQSMAVLGPKQLVLISGGQLLVVTMP
jgi:sugar lactone lactonase YvrE